MDLEDERQFIGLEKEEMDTFTSGQQGETLSQCQAEYFCQNEELSLLRKKCQSLQMTLNKCHDDKQGLELELVAERRQKEQAIRNIEAIMEKNKMDFNSNLYSVKLDQERWKQQAESITREIQLLQEQLKVAQTQKSDALKNLSKLKDEYTEMDMQRRSIDIYIKRQKDSMTDISKRMQQLQTAKEEMVQILEAQRDQIGVFNVHIINQKHQKSVADATIAELEKEIIQLKSAKAKDRSVIPELEREILHLKSSKAKDKSIIAELEMEINQLKSSEVTQDRFCKLKGNEQTLKPEISSASENTKTLTIYSVPESKVTPSKITSIFSEKSSCVTPTIYLGAENKITPSKNNNSVFSGKLATKKDLNKIYGNIGAIKCNSVTSSPVASTTAAVTPKMSDSFKVAKRSSMYSKSPPKVADKSDLTPFEMPMVLPKDPPSTKIPDDLYPKLGTGFYSLQSTMASKRFDDKRSAGRNVRGRIRPTEVTGNGRTLVQTVLKLERMDKTNELES